MIDNPKLTADLLSKLEASLPLPAIVTPYLAKTLREGAVREGVPEASIPRTCQVVWVYYTGDDGGILCKLSVEGNAESERAFFVSITHLVFDRRLPLVRQIGAYQKHRVKRLRRQTG